MGDTQTELVNKRRAALAKAREAKARKRAEAEAEAVTPAAEVNLLMADVASNTKGAPAILPEWRQSPPERLRSGSREIKMLQPRCAVCQKDENVPGAWWLYCTHEPYVTIVPLKEQRAKTEDEMVDGKPTGRKRITGVEEFLSYRPRPNTTERSESMGANAGRGIDWARRKGCIMPSELRSEFYPNGIANACEFRGCFKQTGLAAYRSGTFCRHDEAAVIGLRNDGTPLWVGDSDREQSESRKQLAAVDV